MLETERVGQTANSNFRVQCCTVTTLPFSKSKSSSAVMAEWLRRWTRNPMGSSRAGSNPAHSVSQTFASAPLYLNNQLYY